MKKDYYKVFIDFLKKYKLIEGNYVEELFDFYLELLTSTDNSNIIVSSLKKIVFVMKKPKYW